jgi:hypothetical protein
MQAVCLQNNHCKHQNSSFIYVVFGPEKLVYFIVHNMSVKIILPAACKNGVVVAVSIFLPQFFLSLGNKKKSSADSSKGFL